MHGDRAYPAAIRGRSIDWNRCRAKRCPRTSLCLESACLERDLIRFHLGDRFLPRIDLSRVPATQHADLFGACLEVVLFIKTNSWREVGVIVVHVAAWIGIDRPKLGIKKYDGYGEHTEDNQQDQRSQRFHFGGSDRGRDGRVLRCCGRANV